VDTGGLSPVNEIKSLINHCLCDTMTARSSRETFVGGCEDCERS
jgi:hypothetical protein